jgi:fatty-acyl-CoA synthase
VTAGAVAAARRHGVGDLLHRTARRYPGKLAVVCGDRRATYAEFDASVTRTAHALTDRGLDTGDRLVLLAHNCWEFALIAFALPKNPSGKILKRELRSTYAALPGSET